MSFNIRKIFFPVASDVFAPHTHMGMLADSVTAFIPVANTTERAAVVAASTVSAARPLVFWREDTHYCEITYDGSAFRAFGPTAYSEFGTAAAPLDGSAGPGTAPLLRRSGVTPIESDGNGDASVGFGTAFPNGLQAVSYSIATGVGVNAPVAIFAVMWSPRTTLVGMRPTKTQFFVRLLDAAGTPWTYGNVDVTWQATGW